MSKKPFNKIAAGLRDAIAIVQGRAEPATYKVHVQGRLEDDPRFLRRIKKARRSLRAGRAVRLEDVKD